MTKQKESQVGKIRLEYYPSVTAFEKEVGCCGRIFIESEDGDAFLRVTSSAINDFLSGFVEDSLLLDESFGAVVVPQGGVPSFVANIPINGSDSVVEVQFDFLDCIDNFVDSALEADFEKDLCADELESLAKELHKRALKAESAAKEIRQQ